MSTTHIPASNRSVSSALRVIAALTAGERERFLEPILERYEFAPRIRFAEASELQADRWREQLDQWQPRILMTGWNTPQIPEDWLAQPTCPLRYVCHVVGSVRYLVPRSFIERGGVVTNWGECISSQVAEHGLLLALAALRNQSAWASFIARPANGRQIADLRTRSLFGLRVGIHGFGTVARALLPLLRPFDVTITAHSTGVPTEMFEQHGVRAVAHLGELFAASDVLFECESLTPSTFGLVTAEVLAALPDDAVFVNIGRGGLVDDEALVKEATSGRLRIALDVINAEPMTPVSPPARAARIILSPHIGGPTLDRYRDCGAHALENVALFLAGTRPPEAISLEVYDRAT